MTIVRHSPAKTAATGVTAFVDTARQTPARWTPRFTPSASRKRDGPCATSKPSGDGADARDARPLPATNDRVRSRGPVVFRTFCGPHALQRRLAWFPDWGCSQRRSHALCGGNFLGLDRRDLANLDLPDRTRDHYVFRYNDRARNSPEALENQLTWLPLRAFAPATAAMTDDTIPLFAFPAIEGKKVTAAFDGGRLSSDGGVMLLSMAKRRLGVAQRLARCIPDRRDPSRIAHTIADMIRARVFAICCGYEDADDLDDGERLWTDLRVWAYRGEIVLVSGRAPRRPDRLTSSRRADGCRPTVRCERPCERAARQLIRRKAPRNQRCIIYFVRGRGIDMQTPVDIAFRHCEPSEEIRSEIAAQVQRLEKFSPRITSCRVVVTGPQTGHRRGGFEVELRIAMPQHNEVVVDKSHADAPEREHALVAIREAFDAAVRQIENVRRTNKQTG